MQVARIQSRTLNGIKTVPVIVEVALGHGLPGTNIVGLAETSVKESRDRVKSAINNSGFNYPKRKIIVNLAPADVPKQGGRFDLPIALGILAVDEQISNDHFDKFECIGELALNGLLRSVSGALPTALGIADSGKQLLVPEANAAEASLCTGTPILSAESLTDICSQLATGNFTHHPPTDKRRAVRNQQRGNMAEVKGQYQVKRALEIAAAGGHNLLMSGPPGTGKSMLASRLPGILPEMAEWEATQTAAVASISNRGFDVKNWKIRPFRSPHHTASGIALVGGGSPPKPGEISLAHKGVLFLDELPEYSRHVLDVLREPMETGEIAISRANWQSDFPADFQLVAAMNPCPCGYYGDVEISCRCTPDQIQRYQSRISGPFLDRIDLQVDVPRMTFRELRTHNEAGEASTLIRERVEDCRAVQLKRQNCNNAQLQNKELDEHCGLSSDDMSYYEQVSEKLVLSLRAHIRILRVARTIADLAGRDTIDRQHINEALSLRGRINERAIDPSTPFK